MTTRDAARRFDGVAALVVGAGTGIGRAAALRLAREGARVGVADLDLGAATAVADTLPGGGHAGIAVDVLSPQSVEDAVTGFASGPGALDVLVHVAGGDAAYGSFEQASDEAWRAMFELNLLGPVRMIRQAL